MLCPGSEAGIAEVSLHPVHLLDSMERALPAALIPFCSYQANMSLLGNPGDQFPFEACGKFQPYILEGQLCYSLDLRDIVRGGSGKGSENALLLVLDSNMIQLSNLHIIDSNGKEEQEGERAKKNNGENDEDNSFLETEESSHDNHLARIYLHTMTHFTSSKNGSYVLTVLKKMTGTAGFLKIPDEEKGCQVEIYEECNTRKYLERVGEECKCVPWALNSNRTHQVGRTLGYTGYITYGIY